MKTAQIDLLNVTKKGSVYTAEYWDEASDNENNVTMQISEDSLIQHIEDTGMSAFGLYDMWDIQYPNPFDYLTENLNEVVKDYIQANS